MAPLISIVVPAYNSARYLSSLLATVAGQRLTDWELIIVDDGSTDDTQARLAQAPPDPRRQVLRQANGGSAAARNRGLAAAQGTYVAFLDADDGWHPDFLTRMVAALAAAPEATAAFCAWQYCDEAGQPLPQVVRLSEQEVSQLPQLLMWRNSIMPSSVLARRQPVVALGGFDEALVWAADWDMWLRLIKFGRFVAVPQALTWYRAHSASMTERIEFVESERLRLNAKYLGPVDDGPVSAWPAMRRRAVGYTYFNTALAYLRQGDLAQGRAKARQALAVWPGLAGLDEFFYELGCANQPRGLRGQGQGLDLRAGERLIGEVLGASADPNQWGYAYLVLARLARDAGNASAGRTYALRAMRAGSGRTRLAALRLLARSLLPAGLLQARRAGQQQPTQPPLS